MIKQLTSLVLPFTALILVPLWIDPQARWKAGAVLIGGAALMLIGLLIMALTISSFIRIGKGTLAPWSPTQYLVTEGMYGHVRNPMILAVLIVLLGEAMGSGSWRILTWAVVFFAINWIYFARLEEPGLERRFGEAYRTYKQNVPRWIPRLRPWNRTRGH